MVEWMDYAPRVADASLSWGAHASTEVHNPSPDDSQNALASTNDMSSLLHFPVDVATISRPTSQCMQDNDTYGKFCIFGALNFVTSTSGSTCTMPAGSGEKAVAIMCLKPLLSAKVFTA